MAKNKISTNINKRRRLKQKKNKAISLSEFLKKIRFPLSAYFYKANHIW